MPVMYWIPWLDIFLGLVFLGLIALGFWQGMLKELMFLVSLYLGLILASLYGDYIGSWIQTQFGTTTHEVGSAWGFFIVILAATGLLFSIIYTFAGRYRLPASLLPLDKIGGVVVGVVTSFLLTSFLAYILYAIIPVGPDEWAFSAALKFQLDRSPLLSLFLYSRPVILATIRPWLPAEFPSFLLLQD